MTILNVTAITLFALSLAGCSGGGSATTTTQLIAPPDSAALRLV